jgi:polyphosphate kinase 2 (PPK2 family)
MGKKSKKKNKDDHDLAIDSTDKKNPSKDGNQKLGKKECEVELFKLQVELVKLQDWVKKTGARIVILFEGRDAAGKGGIIKRILERVSPRVFRLVALPAPTEQPHPVRGGALYTSEAAWTPEGQGLSGA